VIWSRLLADLRPYLTERAMLGTRLLSFFHRQMKEAAARRYLAEGDYLRAHQRLAGYFHRRLHPPGGEPFSGNDLRALSELPHHQIRAEQWEQVTRTLTDLRFLEAKVQAGLVYPLAQDCSQAAQAAPDSAALRRLSQGL